MDKTFLLYGANGYTGELIIRYAVERGLKPILMERNIKEGDSDKPRRSLLLWRVVRNLFGN